MCNQRKLVIELLKNISGGQAVAAAYLGITLSLFKDRLYENKGTRFFTCDELLALQELSNTTLVADYFAKARNCAVVELFKKEELDNVELFKRSLTTSSKRGVVDSLLAKALEDGKIDSEEAMAIQKAHIEHLKARDAEVRSTLELHQE